MYHKYLRHGVLGVCIGDTVRLFTVLNSSRPKVFVHGAIKPENLGFVPSIGTKNERPAGPVKGQELKDSHSCQVIVLAVHGKSLTCSAEGMD